MITRPFTGLATDAAHSTKLRKTLYRGVNLSSGIELFYEDIGNQTVNIGEFLGVIHAIKYIIDNNIEDKIIYTDSMTAITWFNNKSTASKLNNKDLKKAEIFLKMMDKLVEPIQVLHWDNLKWGEIPADFGNKK